MSGEELRASWRRFASVPFPTVETTSDARLDALIEELLQFEAQVAGRIDKIVSGTKVQPSELAVPAALIQALREAGRVASGNVAMAVMDYARELVDLTIAAQAIASRAAPGHS